MLWTNFDVKICFHVCVLGLIICEVDLLQNSPCYFSPFHSGSDWDVDVN